MPPVVLGSRADDRFLYARDMDRQRSPSAQLDALIRRLESGDVVLFHRASRLSRGGPLDTFLIKDRI